MILRSSLICFLLAFGYLESVLGCGWYGDAESKGSHFNSQIVDHRGRIINHHSSAEDLFRSAEQLRTSITTRQEISQLLRLYERSASLGHVGAQYTLGLLFETGMHFPVDLQRAANWYRFSSAQGEPHAQHHLGMLYLDGRGVPLDVRQAEYWLLKAAKQGHTGAMPLLAKLYLSEHRDNVNAYLWSKTAASMGNKASEQVSRELLKMIPEHLVSRLNKRSAAMIRQWKSNRS